jgi:hypothetical protein
MSERPTAAPPLLPPGARPGFVGPLAVPGDLWWVVADPPLAGMAYPRVGPWEALGAAGFTHVLCLTEEPPRYDPAPLTVSTIALQDLFSRRTPDDPDRDRARALTAARFVVERHGAGDGVVVHCHGGRGRTGMVLGCALVMLGHDPDAVVDWLHRGQRTRGRRGWPEQPWQATVVRECPEA